MQASHRRRKLIQPNSFREANINLFFQLFILHRGASLVAQTEKTSACNAGDLGSIRGAGRFPGEGNGNPLQCSCPENPRDEGAWWAAVYGVTQSRTRLK